MSFSKTATLEAFYNALGQPEPAFRQHVEQRFLHDLKKPVVKGGATPWTRKEVIQEAVDAMQCYGALDAKDAAGKRLAFETAYRSTFKDMLPPNTPGSGVQAAKMKLIKAKLNILAEKLRLLEHWQRANLDGLVPDNLSADDDEFRRQMFLFNLFQFHPTKVKPVLQLLLNDARDVLDTPALRGGVETWMGADASFSRSFDSTSISKTVKVEAAARAGFQGNAKFEINYDGLKGELSAEVFAGIRAKMQAEGKITPDQIALSGNVHVDIGIVITGEAKFDILDILEIQAKAEALAGAQLDVGGKLIVRYGGVELDLHAEAFAGVRITGEASGSLKLGDRQITTLKLQGQAWAGAGASGSLGFKCSVFGEVSFNLSAGAAVGVGASGGIALTLDTQAIQYGALNLAWVYAAEHGIKGNGRVHFLPLEENQKMSEKVAVALEGMISELKNQNVAEMERFRRWHLIQTRMINGRSVGA